MISHTPFYFSNLVGLMDSLYLFLQKVSRQGYSALLVLAWLFLISFESYAQNMLSKKYNQIRVDDVLQGRVFDIDLQNQYGKGCVWNLTDAKITNKQYRVSFVQRKDSVNPIGVLCKSTKYYFSELTQDTVFLVGLENNLRNCSLFKKLPVLCFPFCYSDSISSFFYGCGKYCDKLNLEVFGKNMMKADAEGSLILPNGTSLSHVLQLHTKTYMSIRKSPLDSLVVLNHSISDDSIAYYMNQDSSMVCYDVITLYAQGFRYPILRKETSRNLEWKDGKNICEVVFFDPAEQNLMAWDEDNKEIRQSLFHEQIEAKEQASSISYRAALRKEKSSIEIEYSMNKNGSVSFLLSDIGGIVYRRKTQNVAMDERQTIELNYGGLPIQGQLILYIVVDGERWVEKFNIN